MNMTHKILNQNNERGFTLVEIAVVLLIISILMAGLIPTISSQMEQKQTNETRKQLDEIQQALIGYAIINERLPCPAIAGSNGVEDPPNAASGVACTKPYDGFVPAATLGITQVNSQGLAIDGWNNPIRYAVSTSGIANNDFTKTGGMKAAGISALNNPNLLVCSTATGTSATSCGGTTLTPNGVVVVLISTGKNGGQVGGTSLDEAANQDGGSSKTFVSHDNSTTYDDIMFWISPNILVNRMIAAGKLP